MFRNEGSAASVNVTEKEDSRVGVSQNKPSTSSPLESPRKRPKLSKRLSCSSPESWSLDRRDIDKPQSEGAESTQNIIDDLNSRLRSSPHDMFGNESENDDNSRFRNLDLTPRVTVQKLSSTLQHFHTTQTFEITPLRLPPLSLPVTERVTPSKSGGGTGGGTQQETGSSPSQPSTPIMLTPPDHSSESSAEGGSGSGNRGRGRGRRPGLTTVGGIDALLKKKEKLLPQCHSKSNVQIQCQ